jgi:hypothetical protein
MVEPLVEDVKIAGVDGKRCEVLLVPWSVNDSHSGRS